MLLMSRPEQSHRRRGHRRVLSERADRLSRSASRPVEIRERRTTAARQYARSVSLATKPDNTYRMNVTVDLNQVAPSSQPYDPSERPYQNWGRILSSENLGWSAPTMRCSLKPNWRMHRGALRPGQLHARSATSATLAVMHRPDSRRKSFTNRPSPIGINSTSTSATSLRHDVAQIASAADRALPHPARAWKLGTVTLLESGLSEWSTISPAWTGQRQRARPRHDRVAGRQWRSNTR